MIIIEGCDTVGKKLLINHLCNNIPQIVLIEQKLKPYKNSEQYYTWLMEILNSFYAKKAYFLFDGFLFNELVRGKALRGEYPISKHHIDEIFNLLRANNPAVIFCSRKTNKIIEDLDEIFQLEMVKRRIDLVQNEYNELFYANNQIHYGGRIKAFDYQNDDINKMLKFVKYNIWNHTYEM